MSATTLGSPRGSERRRARNRSPEPGGASRVQASQVLAMAFLFVMGLYFLLPVWWLVVSSTKTTGGLFSSFGFWFGHSFALFTNVRGVFTFEGSIFIQWILNTILYAGVGAVVGTLLSASAGFALAKYRFAGRELVFSVILGGVLIPGTALALPLYLLMSKFGLTNTIWSVLLPSMVSPFGVYLARVYAGSSVPEELLEAARVDGAGEVRIFRTIVLRILSPALVTIFLFQFVAIWTNFFLPLVMLSSTRLYPITLGLYTWNTQYGQTPNLYAYVVTGAMISVIPLIVAFLSLQRFWRSGLTAGSVKL
jgi:multiple sugar transport system permease protein